MRLSQPPLSYVPLLPVLLGMVAGVLLLRFVPVDIWCVVGGALLLAVAAALLHFRLFVEIALAFSIGAVATSVSLPRQFDTPPDHDIFMHGCVVDAVQLPEQQRLSVDVCPDSGSPFRVMLTYPAFDAIPLPGDSVSFSGSFSLPCRDVDIPLQDDMADYYFDNGISLLCFVPKGNLSVTGRSGNPFYAFKRWRTRLADLIIASDLDEKAAVFLAAILSGDASAVPSQLRSDYAAAGVAHILALSGAHVAVIAMVVSIIFAPLAIAGHRRMRWWLTIISLWLFALFTGMSPSVCRAVIMASAVMLALIFDRPRSSLNALCLAAILILLFSPLSLMQAGFQLSFVATLSIILISPALSPKSPPRFIPSKLCETGAATLAATMGTFPLVAWHFHSVPVYFFIANIVAMAVMPVMIASGILLVVLLLLGSQPHWLLWLLNTAYALFDGVAAFVAHLPGATLDNIYPEGWMLIPMFLTLAFATAYIYLRHRWYAVLSVATLLFTVAAYAARSPIYDEGEAYIVRSRDAVAIASHQGDTLRMLTLAPAHEFRYDSLRWADDYRDYIATRGISCIDIRPLDSVAAYSDGIVDFGSRSILVATSLHTDSIAAPTSRHTDYCLVSSKWYGDPVDLFSNANTDTIVLSTDINRRRRIRYYRELQQASIPAIDLGSRPLSSR